MGTLDGLNPEAKSIDTMDLSSARWEMNNEAQAKDVYLSEDLVLKVDNEEFRFGNMQHLDSGMKIIYFVPVCGKGKFGGLPILSVMHDANYAKEVFMAMIAHGVVCGLRIQE